MTLADGLPAKLEAEPGVVSITRARLAATWVPALRAAGVDPAVTLRAD